MSEDTVGNAVGTAGAPMGGTTPAGPVGVGCPACGRRNVAGASFCEECGTELEAEPPAVDPSRRAPMSRPGDPASVVPAERRGAGPEEDGAIPPPERLRGANGAEPTSDHAVGDATRWWADPRDSGRPSGPSWSSDHGADADGDTDGAYRGWGPAPGAVTVEGAGVGPAASPGGWGRSPSALTPSSSESRLWATGAHLGALVGGFAGGLPAFVPPLVVWLARKDTDPFAAEHGKAALNFNLSVLLYALALGLLTIVTLGLGIIVALPAGAILAVAWFGLSIHGAIKAANREPYAYPLTIPFVR